MAEKNRIERIPPHSTEHEMCTLASMLLDRDCIGLVADQLEADDFYRSDHRMLFRVFVDLFRAGKPVDLVTVPEELRRRGQLDGVGGVGGVVYLAELVECVPSAANAEHYAEVVRQRSVLRSYISAAQRTLDEAWEASDELPEFVDRTERRLAEVLKVRGGRVPENMRDIARQVVDELDQPTPPRQGRPVWTGLRSVDEIVGGFHPGEFVVLAASTSVGKTSLALQVAEHVAGRGPVRRVLYVSREMTGRQLATRSLCARAGVATTELRFGSPDATTRAALRSKLADVPPIHLDNGSTTVGEVRSLARRLHIRDPLGLVVVDYLQLLSGGGRFENRNVEVSAVSSGLQRLALELRVPVLALSQLSREQDKQGRPPKLSDLRDSGSIEQDARVVLFLHRPEAKDKTKVDCIVAKNTQGETGTVRLEFQPKFTRFREPQEGNVPPEYQRPYAEREEAEAEPSVNAPY